METESHGGLDFPDSPGKYNSVEYFIIFLSYVKYGIDEILEICKNIFSLPYSRNKQSRNLHASACEVAIKHMCQSFIYYAYIYEKRMTAKKRYEKNSFHSKQL